MEQADDSLRAHSPGLPLPPPRPLQAGNVASASDFTVTVGGTGVAENSATTLGTAVTLDLGSSVTVGQDVAVSYTMPGGTARVQDSMVNPAGALTSQVVTNEVHGPMLVRADVMANALSTLVLTFDHDLDTTQALWQCALRTHYAFHLSALTSHQASVRVGTRSTNAMPTPR